MLLLEDARTPFYTQVHEYHARYTVHASAAGAGFESLGVVSWFYFTWEMENLSSIKTCEQVSLIKATLEVSTNLRGAKFCS